MATRQNAQVTTYDTVHNTVYNTAYNATRDVGAGDSDLRAEIADWSLATHAFFERK